MTHFHRVHLRGGPSCHVPISPLLYCPVPLWNILGDLRPLYRIYFEVGAVPRDTVLYASRASAYRPLPSDHFSVHDDVGEAKIFGKREKRTGLDANCSTVPWLYISGVSVSTTIFDAFCIFSPRYPRACVGHGLSSAKSHFAQVTTYFHPLPEASRYALGSGLGEPSGLTQTTYMFSHETCRSFRFNIFMPRKACMNA